MDDLAKPLNRWRRGDPAAAARRPRRRRSREPGGLDGLLAKLRAGGLGDAVDSWESTGPNQPVDPDQLGSALGPDTVQRLSSGSGLDIGQLLPMLAMFLPQIIDMLTPDGKVPSGGLNRGDRRRPRRYRRDARRAAGRRSGGADRPTSAACSAGCWAATSRARAARRVRRRRSAARRPDGCPCRWTTSGGGPRRPRRAILPVMNTEPTTVAASRIHGFLEREPVVWLSTVRPGRRPAPRPDLVLVGRRGAPGLLQAGRPEGPQPARAAVGDARPRATPRTTSTSGCCAAAPSSSTSRPARSCRPAHLDKYAAKLAAIGVSAEEYAATYSQVIRIVPDDFLPWHGRTSPQSVRLAGAPARSIDEPREPGLEADGEPVARRLGGPRDRSSNHVDRARRCATGSASRWRAACAA